MAISMLKIRRPLGRLIFNMGIAIPGKTVFLIETAPWILSQHKRVFLIIFKSSALLDTGVIKWKHFRLTGPLWGEYTAVTVRFLSQRPVARIFDVFFDLLKQTIFYWTNGWAGDLTISRWFDTPLRSLWRCCNVARGCTLVPDQT